MNILIKITLFFLLSPQLSAVLAQTAMQDPAATRQVAEQFLRDQTTSLPGEVSVTIGKIDARTPLAACHVPEAFLPHGSRAWGKTSVGVRCKAPAPWTIYIPATVRVMSDYIVTNNPLQQGKIIGFQDVVTRKGDLAALPAGTLTDPAQAIGRTVAVSLSSGIPLRQDALRIQAAVQQGQTVRLVSNGRGFSVSAEAKAMTGGIEGQMVQAKTATGQIIHGVARLGGVVEVAN